MFSKLIERLSRNTALHLTTRFALIFICCTLALFVTVDWMLARTQLEKDQQLVDSFLQNYQRLEQQAGLQKLEYVMERDVPYFQRSDMRVQLSDAQGQQLLLSQPETWGGVVQLDGEMLEGGWQPIKLSQPHMHLLQKSVPLSDGSQLSIAKSTAPRMAEQLRYRCVMLSIMLPLLLLALALTAYINWRALRPVHDLIDTVRALRASDLKARVLVRNPHSELGELAQLFNQMLSQIEQLIMGMQHSLDAVGHDLRTPLARMRLSLEAALSQSDEQVMREALYDCAEESERIETMLKALMDLSEAESGALTLHPADVDVRALLTECIDLYSYTAEDKSIQLTLEQVTDTVLWAAPVRIRQVTANLLDNAIKYSPGGSTVRLRAREEHGALLLEIEDEGCGIAAEDLNQVFDRLYRADKSRSESGMGLGLCLVKAIVEAHRGQIKLLTAPDLGCCAQVRLPKQPVQVVAEAVAK